MLKDIINIYKTAFKQYPLFRVFFVLVLIKAVVFSAYIRGVPYMMQLNNILGLFIIVVCAFMTLRIKSKN